MSFVTPINLDKFRALDLAIAYAFALTNSIGQGPLLKLLIQLEVEAPIGKRLDVALVREVIGRLVKLDILARQQNGGTYIIHPASHGAVLSHLVLSDAALDWVYQLRQALPEPTQRYGNFYGVDGQTFWREYLWAVLGGQYEKAREWLMHQPSNGNFPLPAELLLSSEPPALARLQPNVQALALSEVFSRRMKPLADCSLAYAYAKAHLSELNPLPEDLEYVAIQALLRGDWPLFSAVQARLPEALQALGQAALALMSGNYAQAYALSSAYILYRRKALKNRKSYVPGFYGVLYCLAAIGTNTPASLKAASVQVDEGLKHPTACYGLLHPLLEQLMRGQPITPASRHSTVSIRHSEFDGVIQVIVLYWQGFAFNGNLQQPMLNEVKHFKAMGYHWLAAQLDAALMKIFPVKTQMPGWLEQNQQVPLLNALVKEESWKRALSALANINKPAAAAQSGAQRLVWWLSWSHGDINLEPREQKCSAKGLWSKGRPVAFKRFYNNEFETPLSEQDKLITQCVEREHHYYSDQYELNMTKALPLLVNHPALYWADAPDVRVDVVAGEVTLQLTESKGEIRLRLEPDMDTDDTYRCQKTTPTRLTLYTNTSEIKQIASILGAGLSVPSAAKAQLVEAMSAIAPHIAIHSDLPELAAHIPSQPADTTIYAHLLPLNEGLRLQFLQRPLPEGSWFAPGKGPANVVGEVAGSPLQAVRTLKDEKKRLAQLLEACPSLADAEQLDGEQEWHIEHPEACLELLSELKAQPEDAVQLVWPQGERMRLKGNRSLKEMRLKVKKQGEWFEADGAITLDDGRVIALRELLHLMNDSTGRFLKLGDNDYLALTNNFRRRLQELNAFAETNSKGGLRINPLAAPALAELAAEVGELDADKAWREQVKKLDALADFHPKLPSTLQAELRDYQLQGYQWLARLAHWGVGACLADDMGLGKTVQALALLLNRALGGPALVVAPLSVAMNWLSEAQKFAPTLKVRAYNSNRDLTDLGAFDLVVASYGMLQQDAERFAAQHWHTIVLDEAQAIKNAATKRSQAAMSLTADFKMLASGTPVENHLGELWNLFRFINPGLLGSKERFAQRFSTPIENGNSDARSHLKKLIQPFILRRTKTQVLRELPARTEITLQVELTDAERHLYEALRQQAMENVAVAKAKPMQILAEITKLRRFCCNPKLVLQNTSVSASKLSVFAETLEELLENKHKALVFSQFVDHLAIVREYLDKQGIHYQYLDGSTPALERKKRVDSFQAGEGDVFLISLKAGGTGLNLTAADYVIHLDPWWNPAVEDQASDRAHRMGQQRPVTIYRLVTQNTIEEKIIALHGEKRDLADSLLDGGEAAGKLDTAALLRLLKDSV
ncbi:MAG: hypothetical protein RL497_2961 [Pseudomonadota bacterium]|jgi:SNF2 family DNA or RNA helicase